MPLFAFFPQVRKLYVAEILQTVEWSFDRKILSGLSSLDRSEHEESTLAQVECPSIHFELGLIVLGSCGAQRRHVRKLVAFSRVLGSDLA